MKVDRSVLITHWQAITFRRDDHRRYQHTAHHRRRSRLSTEEEEGDSSLFISLSFFLDRPWSIGLIRAKADLMPSKEILELTSSWFYSSVDLFTVREKNVRLKKWHQDDRHSLVKIKLPRCTDWEKVSLQSAKPWKLSIAQTSTTSSS